MAGVKISDLIAGTSPTGIEGVEVLQDGASRRLTIADFALVGAASGYATVATHAALQALTSRPAVVVTQSYGTTNPNDGGGGTWVWVASSTATADGGTVVTPAGLPAGRYHRQYTGGKDVRWFGAKGDGVTNDRTAILAAMATGGYIVFGGGLTYMGGGYNVTVPGTVIDGLGTATLADLSTGAFSGILQITFNATGSVVKNLTFNFTTGSTTGEFIQANASGLRFDNLTFNGLAVNPNTRSVTGRPSYGINVMTAATSVGYDTVVTRCVFNGGAIGLFLTGADRIVLSDLQFNYQSSSGLEIGSTVPGSRAVVTNVIVNGSGLYGVTYANLNPPTAFKYPHRQNIISNLLTFGCGWTSHYGPENIGGGKCGMDSSSTDLNGNNIQMVGYNNATGTIEIKHTTPAVVPVVSPAGFFNQDYNITDYGNFDFGQGILLLTASASLATTTSGKIRITGSSTFLQPPLWVTGLTYRPMIDIVRSTDGFIWHCFGTSAAGVQGVSGATQPTVPTGIVGRVITPTTGVASGSATIPIAATAGIEVGMTIFSMGGVPDGATIDLVTLNTSVRLAGGAVTTGTVAAGSMMFTFMRNDGTLNWVCMGTDPGVRATTKQGIKIDSINECTVHGFEVLNCRIGALISTDLSSDHEMQNLWFDGLKLRNCVVGIQGAPNTGTPKFTNLHLFNCDIEATTWGVILSGDTAAVNSIVISGGRIRSTTSEEALAMGDSGAGSTLHLDGGLILSGALCAYQSSAASTQAVTMGAVTFMTDAGSNTPVQINGAGTWRWGAGATIHNGNRATNPGWATSSGAIVVSGAVRAIDLVTAPTGGVTQGNVGEYVTLTAPTATEYGYYCTVGPATLTWKKLTLT